MADNHELAFGDLLREGRSQKGYTQQDFAKAADVTQQSVSRWERGEVPPLSTLARISKALDLPLKTLSKYQRPSAPTLADRVRELEDFSQVLASEIKDVKRQAQTGEEGHLMAHDSELIGLIRTYEEAVDATTSFFTELPIGQSRLAEFDRLHKEAERARLALRQGWQDRGFPA